MSAKLTEQELYQYLQERFPKENECCEWKAFTNLKNCVSSSAGNDVISYVSGISNMSGGYLIIGIEDKTLNILGIQNFHDYTPENLPNRLLGNCTHLSSEGLLVESLITDDTHKTVWVLKIPGHLPRQPVIAHKKAWQRSGDSLIELTHSRKEAILYEQLFRSEDWSAQTCSQATMMDLDFSAIVKAIDNYKIKNPRLGGEIAEWNHATFLTKTKMIINGLLTRAAVVLLGKPEAAIHLNPAIAQMTWVLYDKDKKEKDYQHFGPPYIISMDEVFTKIRNLKYRYMKDGTLFPDEVDQYDPQNIREALSNCIAHMDYTAGGRTTVAETMVSFNMIDSIGSGIKRMFKVQRDRFFPMPDYDLGNGKVKVTLTGKVLDMEYAQVLVRNPDLSLNEIIVLDKVQKKKALDEHEIKLLKERGLIEGRKPNFHISSKIAERIEQKADYIKVRGFKDDHYKDMILGYIDKYGSASKEDIDQLILDLLPQILDKNQKENKVRNLVYAMSKRDKTIENWGTNRNPKWMKNS